MDSNPFFNFTSHYYHGMHNATEHRGARAFSDDVDMQFRLGNSASSTKANPTMSSVQRFLNETERPLFMPSILETDAHAMHTLPDIPVHAFHSVRGDVCDWTHLHPFPAPIDSTLESSYVSSEWSGSQHSPLSSPYMTARPHSPPHEYGDWVAYTYGGHPPVERHDSHSPDACVALHDVQKCADELPETFAYSNEPMAYSVYGSYTQEGYQPMQPGDETGSGDSPSTPETDHRQDEDETHRQEPASPVIRRRRPQASRSPSVSTQVSSGRVSKRPNVGRRSSSLRSDLDDAHATSAANRAFPCPLAIYGCTSTFGSKNEWKRHVNTQHMRLGYWRCDQCVCSNGERKLNDFNRKDLFTQHVRRMHPVDNFTSSSTKKSKLKKENTEEQMLQDAATRCYRHLRSPPEKSQCLYCDEQFHGLGSWDERMEHIGRHMENAKKDSDNIKNPTDWHVDEDAEKWFLKQQVIAMQGDELVLST